MIDDLGCPARRSWRFRVADVCMLYVHSAM